jgi:PTH1 family peptidyl-tRNA hydrolase
MAKDVQMPTGRALVVGLGNPGARYDGTRHNIGFLVGDALAQLAGVTATETKFKGQLGHGPLMGRVVSFLKPQTYMNLSGESVGPCAGFYRLTPSSVIVLHDDIDLPAGRVRIKVGGGHGGHNGLRSIDTHLGSKDYFRVRLGVGRPDHGDVSGWVLGRFGADEGPAVERLLDHGMRAVEEILRGGLLHAQQLIHPLG